MYIMGILILSHVILWGLYKSERYSLITISFWITLYSAFWMILLDLELNGSSYGTDETIYYQYIQLVNNGMARASEFPSSGFVQFGAWAVQFAPIKELIWLRLVNIEVYSLTMTLIYLLLLPRLKEWYIRKMPYNNFAGFDRRFLLYFLIFACNGIVIWTVIRIIKEPVLLLFIIISLITVNVVVYSKNWLLKFIFAVISIGLAWSINQFRFGAEYLVLLAFIGLVVKNIFGWGLIHPQKSGFLKASRIVLFGLIASIILIFFWQKTISQIRYIQVYEHLYSNYYGDITTDSLKASGGIGFVLSFFRFILGPGPIRAIQQILDGNIFLVSTKTADVLIFLGALQWWITLALAFFQYKFSKAVKSLYNSFMLVIDLSLISLAHVFMYVFLYAGSGDTRHRALLYILASPLLIIYNMMMNNKESQVTITNNIEKVNLDLATSQDYHA